MADALDADLLALADGDTTDGEQGNPSSSSDTKASPPPSHPAFDVHRLNEASSSKLKMSHKPSGKVNGAASRGSKKARKDDSEEGEASSASSSVHSQDSASMSESESDTSPAGGADDDSPLFPVDGQFYSEKDKRQIMALPEIERESLLADRAHERERKQQNLQLRRLLHSREQSEGKKKRKADAAQLEDSPKRKSTRQKTTLGGRKVGDSSTIETYTRQREENKARNEQRRLEGEERRNRRMLESSPLAQASDADADGESEVEWDDRATSRQPQLDEQPAQQIDFEHVRVGRDNFAKVCFYPGFNEAIANCYVRVNIGSDKATGESIYRLGRIAGFTEGRSYAMEGSNGKSFVTNQYAKVAIGKSEREMPFIACSNSKPTTAEYDRYLRTLSEENIKIPTKPYLISKITDINKLLNRSWTAVEVEEKLQRSGVLQSKFSHIAREDIIRRRQAAEKRGDEATIAKCDAELTALDGPKLAFGTKLYKPASTPAKEGPTQQERLAELNRANRKANTEDVRKAQLAERKAQRLAQEAVARGEAVQDSMARVKTMAKTHHDFNAGSKLVVPKPKIDELFDGKSDGSRAGTPMSRGGTPKPKTVTVPKKSTNGMPKIGRGCADDEIIGAMDFGIEIDI